MKPNFLQPSCKLFAKLRTYGPCRYNAMYHRTTAPDSFKNFRKRLNSRGAALIVVLAFMVLLTGLLIAFLSLSQVQNQVSRNSANQTTAEILADGSVNQIIGDLKDEIVAGSTGVTYGKTTIYFPLKPVNNVPSLSVPGFTAATIVGSGLENVLKVSKFGVSFRPGGMARAADSPTSGASHNGRFISLRSWNKALLMEKDAANSSTDFTPRSFTDPDWILLDRSGNNPTTWSPSMVWSNSPATSTVVVGRYSYVIYNEGGLLDANVAGYPSAVLTKPATSISVKNQVAYKSSLAHADLTKIGLKQAQIDQIVAWRNSATLQATGNGPGSYSLGASNTVYDNYYIWAHRNPSGFMTTVNTTTTATGATDRMFISRLQLIRFLNTVATIGGNSLSSTQNSLRYLGTFSRNLNQPSYIPPTFKYSGAPLILANPDDGGNSAYGKDQQTNPRFLEKRAAGAFIRTDGSPALPGEALIKKRFALDRLAWLTYAGPIASDSGVLNPMSDPGVGTMITQLQTTYGLSSDFLKMGGPMAIRKYFGLEWKKDTADGQSKWFYSYNNNATGAPATGSAGPIMTLGDISALGTNAHEPDFFEVLKASVCAGSKARVSTKLSVLTGSARPFKNTYDPYYVQTLADRSLDYAIIQLGANIIAQASLDAYPPRIVFNDGSNGPLEFRGVENLPYLYRVHFGLLKLRMENPLATGASPVPMENIAPNKLKDMGVVATMLMPDLWNPHDVNSAPGFPASSSFRVIAESALPKDISTSNQTAYFSLGAKGSDSVSGGSGDLLLNPKNPNNISSSDTPYPTAGPDYVPFSLEANGAGGLISRGLASPSSERKISSNNTAVDFSSIVLTFDCSNPSSTSSSTLFREPTLLAKPGVPSGSNLAMRILSDADLTGLRDQNGKPVYTGSGLISAAPNPLRFSAVVPQPLTQDFTGFITGLYPVRWLREVGSGAQKKTRIFNSHTGNSVGTPYLTYSVQCRNPNALNGNGDPAGSWMTYDSKYSGAKADVSFLNTPFGSGTTGSLIQGDSAWISFTDPRTSTFSAVLGQNLQNNLTQAGYKSTDWISQLNCILPTNREGTLAGYGVVAGRYPGLNPLDYIFASAEAGIGWNSDSTYLRNGLFSQNSPLVKDDGRTRTATEPPTLGTAGGAFTYYSDPDGVVRRAMGGYVAPGASTPASTVVGLPMATATTGAQSQSRPIVLNRPFQSVAELGQVFSGTPWKNVDFFTPESGDSALLDIFCTHESTDPDGLEAGKVDLNTRQLPVLQAILSGTYVDEQYQHDSAPTTAIAPLTDSITVESLANALVARSTSTADTSGPLENVSELVGKYVPGYLNTINQPFDGFTNDLGAIFQTDQLKNIQRFREAPIRALAANGQTRVWNLMIDVVAQSGRFPTSATNVNDFLVEGERRYWVHVAIDRLTGQVIDKQVELIQK